MSKKIIRRNLLATSLLELVAILNGLIVPKIFISVLGSEANGLATSINQCLSYISLLEGGLSSVVMASLYKPLRENNQEKISAIFNATQRFFKQIGLIYIVYAAVLALVYPLVVKSTFSYPYILVLVLVLATNLFTQYFFSLTHQVLIRASQNHYFLSLTKAGVMLLNMVLVIVFSRIFPDLIIMKALSATVLFLQPVAFSLYTRKRFKLDKKIPRDTDALNQRWSGFGHTLAHFINKNISVIVLTVFSTLAMVSVFSVYLMVANSIRNFAVSIASTLLPSFGSVLAKDDIKEANRAFNLYEFGMAFLSVLLFSCGIVLVVPFIKVYTANVTDANYIQPLFGILLMTAEMLYCFREPYINATYAAGHFKQTAKYAYIEVSINIVLSLILVHKFDLAGVALSFLIAIVYRLIAQVIYLRKNILNRPLRRFGKTVVLFFVPCLGVVLLSNLLLPLEAINGYFHWALNGFAVFGITLVILVCVSLIGYRSELKTIVGKKFFKKKPQGKA